MQIMRTLLFFLKMKKSFLESLPTEIINLWFENFLVAIKELKKEKTSEIPFIESLDYIF